MKINWPGYGRKLNGDYAIEWYYCGTALTSLKPSAYRIMNWKTGRIVLELQIEF